MGADNFSNLEDIVKERHVENGAPLSEEEAVAFICKNIKHYPITEYVDNSQILCKAKIEGNSDYYTIFLPRFYSGRKNHIGEASLFAEFDVLVTNKIIQKDFLFRNKKKYFVEGVLSNIPGISVKVISTEKIYESTKPYQTHKYLLPIYEFQNINETVFGGIGPIK